MCDSCGCSKTNVQAKKLITIKQNLLEKNDTQALQNRKYFRDQQLFVLNMMSGPGSGKTTLLKEIISSFFSHHSVAVIEGDQETDDDAKQFAEFHISCAQVNTGKACHLNADVILNAVKDLNLSHNTTVFIENVGNLICPASFDLGEDAKVVLLSVTEGDNKPKKYPYIFHKADIVIINKIDLLPHVEFDIEKCEETIKQINPNCRIFRISAKTGEGIDLFFDWVHKSLHGKHHSLL